MGNVQLRLFFKIGLIFKTFAVANDSKALSISIIHDFTEEKSNDMTKVDQ